MAGRDIIRAMVNVVQPQVPAHLVAETYQQVVDTMQTPPPGFTVPITAEIGTGRTWAKCKAGEVDCTAAA
jgi:hypothetical protein